MPTRNAGDAESSRGLCSPSASSDIIVILVIDDFAVKVQSALQVLRRCSHYRNLCI